MFSAKREESPNPLDRITILKVTVKTNVKMELSGRLQVEFWIPGNFHRTSEKPILGRNFIQLGGYFVPTKMKLLSGNFCSSRE